MSRLGTILPPTFIFSWALCTAAPALSADVRFTEIHYHPKEGDALEFIELHNAGVAPVDLRGWSFTDGIRFAFESPTILPAGGFLVVARSRIDQIQVHRLDPSLVLGDFEGALDNAGERIALVDGEGNIADEVTYDDAFPYDSAADGSGASLERLCLDAPADAPFSWRAQAPSPGRHEAVPVCPPAPPPPDPEASPIIIDEIHYHPPGDPDPKLEFVELFNRSSGERDLSIWSFDRGLSFTFPAGTRVAAGGYLVVAQDPDLLASRFGLERAKILGPFADGSHLSNSGETVRLVDASGAPQDEVEYGQDGAWCALADGLGGSLQRVSPLGPSSAPGNWRAVAPPPEEEPQADWREFHVEGIHDGPRFYFYLLGAGEALLDDLRLEPEAGGGTDFFANGRLDDGMTGWGATGNHSGSSVETQGGHGDGGPCLRVRATGVGNGFQNGVRYAFPILPDPEAACVLTFHVKPLSGESQFIARSSLAQGDDRLLYLKADSRTGQSSPAPTPLSENNVADPPAAAGPGPGNSGTPASLEFLGHEPAWPTSGQSVAIAARVASEDPVEVSVTLQVGSGAPLAVPLADDGRGGDACAGDGIFGGMVPPAPDGSLVWLTIVARTSGGAATSWPPFGNPAGVTGYYVTDTLPEQNGDLRLFYIFTPGALLDLTCEDHAYRKGDLVDFRGRAYRGVGVKFRGETACFYPKKPMRVQFSKGDRLDGQSDLNLSACWNDKSMLREQFAFDFFRDAGVAYCETHMARVHTNGGKFHGAYFTIEDPDERYLERNLRDAAGGLYKCRTAMLSGGTGGYEPRTDASAGLLPAVGAFATDLNRLSGQDLIGFLNGELDVEGVMDYQAVQVIIIDGDSVMKNWLLYYGTHELGPPGAPLFNMFPWDLDLSYGQMLLTTDDRHHDIHPLFQTQTYPFHDQGYHGILNALLQRAPGDFYVKAFYGRIWRFLEEKFDPAVLFPKLDDYEAATGDTVRQDLRTWPRTWGARGTDPDYWRKDFRTFVTKRYEFLRNYLTQENPTTLGRSFRYVPSPRVKFTEIHYNPPGPGSSFEFVELTSLEDAEVAIGGWSIPLLAYVFPAGAKIPARGTIIVAKDPERLREDPEFAGLALYGPCEGTLPGRGGILRLSDDGDGGKYFPESIDVVLYESRAPWPEAADGGGRSLELVGLDLDNDEPWNWRAGWSPGRAAAENSPPVAALKADPRSGPAPLSLLLSGLASWDPDGDTLGYTWTLDGTAIDSRAVLIRRLESPGPHAVSLIVRDDFGGQGQADITVDVGEATEAVFRRGDSNGDGVADLSDAVGVLGFLFLGGAAPGCPDAADSNDSGDLNLSDAIHLLSFLFTGGTEPPAPGAAACGFDPTEDPLGPCPQRWGCP